MAPKLRGTPQERPPSESTHARGGGGPFVWKRPKRRLGAPQRPHRRPWPFAHEDHRCHGPDRGHGEARRYTFVQSIIGLAYGSPREPLHNFYQLTMRGGGRIVEFIGRVRVGEPAKADELFLACRQDFGPGRPSYPGTTGSGTTVFHGAGMAGTSGYGSDTATLFHGTPGRRDPADRPRPRQPRDGHRSGSATGAR
jgi:hypothetical protein